MHADHVVLRGSVVNDPHALYPAAVEEPGGGRSTEASLQHQIQPIRSLLRQLTSLDTCRYVARLQLEYLRRAGVLAYRRPAVNHGHFRPGPQGE
jgi:hypothetical protein